MLGDKWSSSSSLRGSKERGIESVDAGLGRCGELLIPAAASAMKKKRVADVAFTTHRTEPLNGTRLHCSVLCLQQIIGLSLVRKEKVGRESPNHLPLSCLEHAHGGYHQLMLGSKVSVTPGELL